MTAMVGTDEPTTADVEAGTIASTWVVQADDESQVAVLDEDPLWGPVEDEGGSEVWTDDYSNLLSLFRGLS